MFIESMRDMRIQAVFTLVLIAWSKPGFNPTVLPAFTHPYSHGIQGKVGHLSIISITKHDLSLCAFSSSAKNLKFILNCGMPSIITIITKCLTFYCVI